MTVTGKGPAERVATAAGGQEPSDLLVSAVQDGINQRILEAAHTLVNSDANLDKHVGAAVGKTIGQAIGDLDPGRNPQSVVGLRNTMVIQPLRLPRAFFGQQTTGGNTLAGLLGQTHTLTSAATHLSDGRKARLVLCFVHDPAGLTRRGIEVRLLDSTTHEMLDRTLTDDGGLALLRFPSGLDETQPVSALIKVLGTTLQQAVTVPALIQHTVADLSVSSLPDLPLGPDGTTPLPPPLGDDPLERLPADFSPELGEAIVRLRGATRDPILGNASAAAANGADFRGRRTPLIKKMVLSRTAPDGQRYLVSVRQEWIFLGYTLGELKQVTPLDPGQVVRTLSSTVERTVNTARRSTDQLTAQALSMTSSMLSQLSSIDTLVHVATRNSVTANVGANAGIGISDPVGGIVGGVVGGLLAGPIGAIVGGLFGGGAGVHTSTDTGTTVLSDTTTSTNTDTSLLVNSLLQTAQSTVNTAISTASQLTHDLQSQLSDVVDEISPLLSRVTNLIRWTMYENYAVISRIEDVVAVHPFTLDLTGDSSDHPVFSDEDIVELRRWFAPALLDPTLGGHFDVLRDAVATRLSGGTPVRVVHLEIDYAATLIGGSLTIDLGETRRVIALTPDAGSVRVVLPIPPTMPGDLDGLELTLNAVVPEVWLPIIGNISDQIYASGAIQVDRVRMWFNGSPAARPDQVAATGSGLPDPGLVASTQTRTASTVVDLSPPVRNVDTSQDPLFRHVNRNKSYYLTVLFEAARSVPSLRADVPQLVGLDARIWELPIFGFDGDRVLVLEDVKLDEGSYPQQLMDDGGAATIVQLAAPGAYSEALQGLLQLGDAAGLLHPVLDPPKPVLPPVALVDLDNKHLVPIQQNGVLGAVETVGGGTLGGALGGTGGTSSGGIGVPLPTPPLP